MGQASMASAWAMGQWYQFTSKDVKNNSRIILLLSFWLSAFHFDSLFAQVIIVHLHENLSLQITLQHLSHFICFASDKSPGSMAYLYGPTAVWNETRNAAGKFELDKIKERRIRPGQDHITLKYPSNATSTRTEYGLMLIVRGRPTQAYIYRDLFADDTVPCAGLLLSLFCWDAVAIATCVLHWQYTLHTNFTLVLIAFMFSGQLNPEWF